LLFVVSLKVFSKALNYIDISLIFDFVTYSLYICVYEKVLFLDFDGVMCRPECGSFQ
jgi:hypothetical protein